METEPSTPIEREVRIAAPPTTVYRYFVDPERMVQWLSNHAEIDPRPGGRIRRRGRMTPSAGPRASPSTRVRLAPKR